ncbi:MAG: hypothetical protein HY763_02200 [Planctomycetes bacterium]|nr:hypothetical protein [Planctomycetota bacterium]
MARVAGTARRGRGTAQRPARGVAATRRKADGDAGPRGPVGGTRKVSLRLPEPLAYLLGDAVGKAGDEGTKARREVAHGEHGDALAALDAVPSVDREYGYEDVVESLAVVRGMLEFGEADESCDLTDLANTIWNHGDEDDAVEGWLALVPIAARVLARAGKAMESKRRDLRERNAAAKVTAE